MRELDESEFNTEHVIPQSFGKFEQNLTLNKSVCCECNSSFGDQMDRILARDSVEAYERVRHGLKDKTELDELPYRQLNFSVADEGEWTGLRVILKSENGKVVVDLVPQVRLSRKDGQGYEFVVEMELENLDESLLNAIDRTADVAIFPSSEEVVERLIGALRKIGIEFERQGYIASPKFAQSDVGINVHGKIDAVVKRCAAKIAFNYLAYTSGANFVRGDEFNTVRSYIRHGTTPDYSLIRVSDDPILADDLRHSRQTEGHLVTVNWTGDKRHIIAQLSLFNRVTYHVYLARNFQGFWREIRSGHHFDVGRRSIDELTATSLIVP